MNIEQKKFNKRVKANKRRKAYLATKRVGGFTSRSYSRTSPVEVPKAPQKEGFISKIIRRTRDKMQRRLIPK